MQVVTVGPKYQVVIPKEVRKKLKALRPGMRVTVHKADDDTIIVKTHPEDWHVQTRGMLRDALKDIDTTAYLKELRDEWDR